LFSQCGCVGVILDEDRDLQFPLEICFERKVVPIREVGRCYDNALGNIDDAGRSDAYRCEVLPVPYTEVTLPLDALDEPPQDLIMPVGDTGGFLVFLKNYAIPREKRGPQVRAAEVHPDQHRVHEIPPNYLKSNNILKRFILTYSKGIVNRIINLS
jgi:hypothetical protein